MKLSIEARLGAGETDTSLLRSGFEGRGGMARTKEGWKKWEGAVLNENLSKMGETWSCLNSEVYKEGKETENTGEREVTDGRKFKSMGSVIEVEQLASARSTPALPS